MRKENANGHKKQLELQALQVRLDEAEDTLRAIRSGEVDALVVSGTHGDQVYTLEGAEQPYRILVETMNEDTVTVLPDHTVVYSNPRFSETVRLPLEQVIGSSFDRFLPAPQQPLLQALLERCRRAGGKAEFTLLAGDGIQVPVQLSVRPVGNTASGGFCLVITDLTEHNQAEDERAYLAAIVESSDDAIISKTPEGIIQTWNRGAEILYGYAPAEVIGQSVSLLAPPERREELAGFLARIKRGEEIKHHESSRVTKSGRHIDVSITISPLKSAAGEVIGASTIARDITERKRAEEALRRSNAYNRSLIEVSLYPVVTIAPNGKIANVNLATEKVTGRPRAKLIGADFSDYFTDPGKARAGYQRIFREGFLQDYELEIRHRNGHSTPVLYNASVLRDENGEVIGAFAAARDITERKRAEDEGLKLNEQLEQRVRVRAAELEGANEELEAFTYSVTHDLRAPLRHVDGFSKLLSEEHKAELSPEAVEYVTVIRESVQRMGMLIDDLLNLARVGRKELKVQVTGLNSLAQEIIAELERANPTRHIQWNVHTLPFVECDPALMKRVCKLALQCRQVHPPAQPGGHRDWGHQPGSRGRRICAR